MNPHERPQDFRAESLRKLDSIINDPEFGNALPEHVRKELEKARDALRDEIEKRKI